MLPLRWPLQATTIRFYLERRSLFPLCCFRFSFSPERVRLLATRACLAHFPLESSFKIKVSGREGRGCTLSRDPCRGKHQEEVPSYVLPVSSRHVHSFRKMRYHSYDKPPPALPSRIPLQAEHPTS